jgi:antitoxin (DNA-binding transcriptional repressor) of toxin-antitoxin stability system
MKDMTATDASRGFSELLDAVEHRGESFRILRRGRTVALVIPPRTFGRDDLAALLARHRPDEDWGRDLAQLRDLVREP